MSDLEESGIEQNNSRRRRSLLSRFRRLFRKDRSLDLVSTINVCPELEEDVNREEQWGETLESPYPYKRLDETEIRILTILPDLKAEGIHGTLETVSLANSGSFRALSYCWGDPNVTAPLVVDGVQVEVTVNLNAALIQLRVRGYTRIWIDAICINQHDLDERRDQVRLMKQIFSQADEVICWIGESLSDSFETCEKIFLGRSRNTSQLGVIEEIDDFFAMPYWNRVWVIQEVAVAKEVKVLFGDFEIPWPSIASYLGTYRLNPHQPNGAQRLSRFHNRISLLGQPMSHYEALEWSAKAMATISHDKIFAILGISQDGPLIVPVPDYRKPLNSILIEMTASMIRESRSLDIICLESGVKMPLGTRPSWTPDWLHLWDADREVPYIETMLPIGTRTYYEDPILKRIDDNGILVRGMIIDIVSTLSTSTGSLKKQQEGAPKFGFDREILQTLSMMTKNDDLGSGINNVDVSAPLLAWSPHDFNIAPSIDRWCFQHKFINFGGHEVRQWWRDSTVQSECHGRTITKAVCETWMDRDSFSEFKLLVATILKSGMHLMSTEKFYLGMAPPETREGDSVAFLQSCSKPVILRDITRPGHVKPRTFSVVGAAFLHWSLPNYDDYQNFIETGLEFEGMEVEKVVLR